MGVGGRGRSRILGEGRDGVMDGGLRVPGVSACICCCIIYIIVHLSCLATRKVYMTFRVYVTRYQVLFYLWRVKLSWKQIKLH